MNRKEIEARIVERAWADESFKRQLLQNPKQALEAELGQAVEGFRLPDRMQVTVIEEKPDQIVIVLPVNPAGLSGELRHEDLAHVSGGTADPTGEVTPTTVIPPIAPKGMGGFGIAVGPSPVVW